MKILAEEIVSTVPSDRIVIVCKDSVGRGYKITIKSIRMEIKNSKYHCRI